MINFLLGFGFGSILSVFCLCLLQASSKLDEMEEKFRIEEMADAYICLKLLESIFNISPEDMQKAIDVKMDRERKR